MVWYLYNVHAYLKEHVDIVLSVYFGIFK